MLRVVSSKRMGWNSYQDTGHNLLHNIREPNKDLCQVAAQHLGEYDCTVLLHRFRVFCKKHSIHINSNKCFPQIRGVTFLEFNLLTPSCSLITRFPLPETIFSRSESISLIICGSVRSNCTTVSNSSLFEVEESPEKPSVHDPWVVQYWKQTRQSWARFDVIFAGKNRLLLVDPGSAASSNKLNMKTTKH